MPLFAADLDVDARTALAIAATYVVGFRAAHGLHPLGALDDEAGLDAAADVDLTALASYASTHDDAHLVKYTLACIYAADSDPAWAHTYLTAAQYLADLWRAR